MKMLITCGGSGGHLFPDQAIINELAKARSLIGNLGFTSNEPKNQYLTLNEVIILSLIALLEIIPLGMGINELQHFGIITNVWLILLIGILGFIGICSQNFEGALAFANCVHADALCLLQNTDVFYSRHLPFHLKSKILAKRSITMGKKNDKILSHVDLEVLFALKDLTDNAKNDGTDADEAGKYIPYHLFLHIKKLVENGIKGVRVPSRTAIALSLAKLTRLKLVEPVAVPRAPSKSSAGKFGNYELSRTSWAFMITTEAMSAGDKLWNGYKEALELGRKEFQKILAVEDIRAEIIGPVNEGQMQPATSPRA